MDKYLKGYEVTFLFDIRTSCKIKFFDCHLTKPWVAYVTQNNVFALWDYHRKICLKTFNTSILDPSPSDSSVISLSSKSTDLKNLRFLDKETLCWLYPTSQPTSEKEADILSSFNRSSIIFHNEQKIVFYDYVTDHSDVISSVMLEGKTVKCISVMSQQYLLIGCGDGLIKVFDIVAWSMMKTLKGYHTKTVTSIISFKQNLMTRPKFIASSSDGLMGCWGVDSESGPAFKFLMLKKGKPVTLCIFVILIGVDIYSC